MATDLNTSFLIGDLPKLERGAGSAQHDILFSVMKIIHRQPLLLPAETEQPEKVNRLSCCCRISELMPLVRQLHDDARAKALARIGEDAQQAA
jgi:hypothetical protein